jgi:hypothetical protein
VHLWIYLLGSGLNLHFDRFIGFMPVIRVYFGVANLGLPLRPIKLQVSPITLLVEVMNVCVIVDVLELMHRTDINAKLKGVRRRQFQHMSEQRTDNSSVGD